MARIATGYVCPEDHQSVTCVGNAGDEWLIGICDYCGRSYSIASPGKVVASMFGVQREQTNPLPQPDADMTDQFDQVPPARPHMVLQIPMAVAHVAPPIDPHQTSVPFVAFTQNVGPQVFGIAQDAAHENVVEVEQLPTGPVVHQPVEIPPGRKL